MQPCFQRELILENTLRKMQNLHQKQGKEIFKKIQLI